MLKCACFPPVCDSRSSTTRWTQSGECVAARGKSRGSSAIPLPPRAGPSPPRSAGLKMRNAAPRRHAARMIATIRRVVRSLSPTSLDSAAVRYGMGAPLRARSRSGRARTRCESQATVATTTP